MSKQDKVIVALDGMRAEEVRSFISKSHKYFDFYKFGLELFCRYGKGFLQELHDQYKIRFFLDLKLHDIPKTVAKSIESLEGLPVELLTLHLTGGQEMINMAAQARDKYLPQTKLLGVTYLTSLSQDDISTIWQGHKMDLNQMISYAEKTKIDGLVMSGFDLDKIKETNLLKVTPGIRFAHEIETAKTQDQKRVTTPQLALKNGASFLVMGRSLTQANDLKAAIAQF